MASFEDVPFDCLPLIVQHCKPRELACLSVQVSHTSWQACSELLLRDIETI